MSRSTRRRISVGISASFVSYLLEHGRPEGIADGVGTQAVEVDGLELRGLDPVDLGDREVEGDVVAIFRLDLFARIPIDRAVEELLGQRNQVPATVDDVVLGQVNLALEQLTPQRVDALALLVHDVVVLEEVLADGEVLRLDLLLRARDGVGHHLVLDGDAFLHAEPLHEAGDAIGAEDAHQVVFERQIEAG